MAISLFIISFKFVHLLQHLDHLLKVLSSCFGLDNVSMRPPQMSLAPYCFFMNFYSYSIIFSIVLKLESFSNVPHHPLSLSTEAIFFFHNFFAVKQSAFDFFLATNILRNRDLNFVLSAKAWYDFSHFIAQLFTSSKKFKLHKKQDVNNFWAQVNEQLHNITYQISLFH